jgi:hypothetical protein
LRRTLNEKRNEILLPYLETLNNELPEGVGKYTVGKPKMIKRFYKMKNRIVVPVEIILEVQENCNPDEQGFYPLKDATVLDTHICGQRLCKYPIPYTSWPYCKFNNKVEFFQTLQKRRSKYKTEMATAIEKAKHEKEKQDVVNR